MKPIQTSIGKPRKSVDPEVLRKRIDNALATLKNSVIRAMRDGLLPKAKGMPINGQLAELDQTISSAFPAPAAVTESMARLPF